MKRIALFWFPALLFALAAACIPADMPTGHRNYDSWQQRRALLLWIAALYTAAAAIVRVMIWRLRRN